MGSSTLPAVTYELKGNCGQIYGARLCFRDDDDKYKGKHKDKEITYESKSNHGQIYEAQPCVEDDDDDKYSTRAKWLLIIVLWGGGLSGLQKVITQFLDHPKLYELVNT